MADMSRIDKIKTKYKGEYINGYFNENYKFLKDTDIIIADCYINARNEKTAVNKLLRALNLPIYKYIEDFENDKQCGYIHIEETNFYETETNIIYKYYVCVTMAE